LVVSKGDTKLTELQGRRGWHFPQTESGAYAGYYPANSGEAIVHLEQLRMKGAQYLVFPTTALWWLEHYSDFARHLRENYVLVGEDDACAIFELSGHGIEPRTISPHLASPSQSGFGRRTHEFLNSLLPPDSPVVIVGGDEADFEATERMVWCVRSTGSDDDTATFVEGLVAQVENLRRRGAQFLVASLQGDNDLELSASCLRHFSDHYVIVARREHLCSVFDLNQHPSDPPGRIMAFPRGHSVKLRRARPAPITRISPDDSYSLEARSPDG
jgi:hypothetical protein